MTTKSSGGSDNPRGTRGNNNDNPRTRVTNNAGATNVLRAATIKPVAASMSMGIGMRATSMAPRQSFGGMGMGRGMGGGAPRMSFGRGFMR